MTIKEFIKEQIFKPRINKQGILIVYDHDQRYRILCSELANDGVQVIDASENSITSREMAVAALLQLGKQGASSKGMLVYVPARRPNSDEEKQRDPFSIYTVFKSIFPDGDGDQYIEICKRYKPDFVTDIIRIFNQNPNPEFNIIDAVGRGSNWPILQSMLSVESARDILFALLVPSEVQKNRLANNEIWANEARELISTCFGIKLLTKINAWHAISDELWRIVLFSEFVFDLPNNIPDTLASVPCVIKEARSLVEDLCDRLRNDHRTQNIYIERADLIEKELALPQQCIDLNDLGIRDTFAFEERTLFAKAINALKNDDIGVLREILMRHRESIWANKAESQAQWEIIRTATSVVEKCDDYERQLPEHSKSIDHLLNYYVSSLREADQLQREFEQSIGDYIEINEEISYIIRLTRNRYDKLASKAHELFIRHIEKVGWPVEGWILNTDVFDKKVAPKIQESGRKVAYFLVDALRYEMGVVLEKQLVDEGTVELTPGLAQLPTITSVGMAGLLPEAAKLLTITQKDNDISVSIASSRLTNVSQRMEMIKQRYGQRFAETTLLEFTKKDEKILDSVDLLVIRSSEIDSHMENNPETAFGLISDTFKRIRIAINKLKKMSFHDVVIATDHGYYLNFVSGAGDVCTKPQGNWVNIHERFLLGEGVSDNANLVLSTDQLGIRGNFNQAATPRALVPYRAGLIYYHGGLSLQECIVPIISVRLSEKQKTTSKPEIILSYKNGAKRITTLLPVINIELTGQIDLFSSNPEYEILLEAHDSKGNVVGEVKAGEAVNPSTGTITVKTSGVRKVTMRMKQGFEGKFVIKAMNPATLVTYSKLELETDYVG